MWIRLGSFAVVPGRAEELRATYNLDCAPIVRAVAGNLDCYLMENAEDGDRCIVCTVWESEADAVAYEASGTAQAIVARVRGFFAGPPTLASYRVERGR